MLGHHIPKHSIIVPDWEATNEAIEEQVARESYLQWLRDNERRHAGNSKSATVTSADLRQATSEATSPSRAKNLVEEETKAARSSPKPCCSHTTSSEPLQSLVSKKSDKNNYVKLESLMYVFIILCSRLQKLVAHPKEIVQSRAPLVNLSPPPTYHPQVLVIVNIQDKCQIRGFT